jgi:hypothetical protein
VARVPIEIAIVGENNITDVLSAVALANAEQDEFTFCIVDNEFPADRMVAYFVTTSLVIRSASCHPIIEIMKIFVAASSIGR